MGLQEWLRQHGMTPRRFAKKIDATVETVNRWINGGSIPNGALLLRVEDVTKGEVRLESFVETFRTAQAAQEVVRDVEQDAVGEAPPIFRDPLDHFDRVLSPLISKTLAEAFERGRQQGRLEALHDVAREAGLIPSDQRREARGASR